MSQNDLQRQREEAAARAVRIATVAAEELIRSAGIATSGIDEFSFAGCQVDEHTQECIDHLVAHGEAHTHTTADGYVVVQLIDLTLEGLA